MSKAKFEVDVSEVLKTFKNFTNAEVKKTAKSALRRGASVLARQTKKNLISVLPNATKRNIRYIDTLVEGIKFGAYKKGNVGFVHILGSRKSGSGTYRLRFFEKGTKLRKHQSGKTIGKIKALNFFSSARSSSKSQIKDAMTKQLVKMIKRINDKKHSVQ